MEELSHAVDLIDLDVETSIAKYLRMKASSSMLDESLKPEIMFRQPIENFLLPLFLPLFFHIDHAAN